MKEAVIKEIKSSLKSLSTSKKNKRKTGKLKYKSEYNSINLQQYGITYKFYDDNRVRLQGIKKPLKLKAQSNFQISPELKLLTRNY